MLTKLVAFLTITAVAAMLFKHLRDDSRAEILEEEIAGQLNALRAHLFNS